MTDLIAVVGRDRVTADRLQRSLFDHDASQIRGSVSVVCFPMSPGEVQACVRVCRRHGRPFVARGSGTGLSGGAVPLDEAVVIVTTKMNRVLEVNLDDRYAWVEPGVLNLDLSRAVIGDGVHFAPDPSSQAACSIGGNIANNAGGPHCLAYGVTSAHVLAVEVVLPDGEMTILGGLDAEPDGLDLRGAFVGSEGCCGIATRIAVRLTANPPSVRTMLIDFMDVRAAASLVSAVIGAGMVPAAVEMMDQRCVEAVEGFIQAGLPIDAAALVLIEVDGETTVVERQVAEIVALSLAHGARQALVAQDEVQRALWWKGRKSAFGAIARVKPDYYLNDTVVPRTKLPDVLDKVYEIAERYGIIVLNVFHAGDGNLHPLLVFDRREPGMLDKVHAAGAEIVQASIDAGGVLSGEHGIGLEKRDFMGWMFSDEDLLAQDRLRGAFDPERVANPDKVLPRGSHCGEIHDLPDGVWV